jgi:hypothetical protein
MTLRKYDDTTTWAPPAEVVPGQEMTTSVPARAPTFIGDVVVPLVQALITGGLLGGLLVLVLAVVVPDFGGDLLALWAITSLTLSSGAWLLLLGQHRKLLWAIERVTSLDLDGDGEAGPPEKRTIEVHVKDRGHTRIVGADWLGIDDDRLILFAAGLVRGRGLTEGEWGRDKAAFPKGMNHFRAVRGKLLEAGLIERVNPEAENSTYRATAAGRAVFKRLAKLSHAHTHEEGA